MIIIYRVRAKLGNTSAVRLESSLLELDGETMDMDFHKFNANNISKATSLLDIGSQ